MELLFEIQIVNGEEEEIQEVELCWSVAAPNMLVLILWDLLWLMLLLFLIKVSSKLCKKVFCFFLAKSL